jgi:hypothetical protein
LAARTGPPSLLAGLLFDHDGDRMTLSHAVKKRHALPLLCLRPLITKDHTESPTGLRIPAAEIEQLVTSRLRRWLLDPGSVYTAKQLPDPPAQRRLAVRTAEIGKSCPELPAARQRGFLSAVIERIDIGINQIDIHVRPTGLGALLGIASTALPSTIGDETQILSMPVPLCRREPGEQNANRWADPFATAKLGARLIKLLIRARRFNATLASSDGVPFAALAKREPPPISRALTRTSCTVRALRQGVGQLSISDAQ